MILGILGVLIWCSLIFFGIPLGREIHQPNHSDSLHQTEFSKIELNKAAVWIDCYYDTQLFGVKKNRNILLMEEILHHLGWIKWLNPVNNGINYQPQLVIAGFLPSTVSTNIAHPKIPGFSTWILEDANLWGCPKFSFASPLSLWQLKAHQGISNLKHRFDGKKWCHKRYLKGRKPQLSHLEGYHFWRQIKASKGFLGHKLHNPLKNNTVSQKITCVLLVVFHDSINSNPTNHACCFLVVFLDSPQNLSPEPLSLMTWLRVWLSYWGCYWHTVDDMLSY